jgi:hypothetical protein
MTRSEVLIDELIEMGFGVLLGLRLLCLLRLLLCVLSCHPLLLLLQ